MTIVFFTTTILLSPTLNAKDIDTISPKVFLIGENEELMEKVNKQYPTLLMSVIGDMDLAWDKWMTMLTEMEAYSDKIGYDIKGLKLWLNVYWDKSGKIDYIGFYLKPNSRNVKPEELSAFFSSFIKNYKMPVSANSKFYHNGSATFPTHYKLLKSQNGNGK